MTATNIGSWRKTRTCHQPQGALNKRLAELFRVCRIMHMEPRNVLPWTAGQGVMRHGRRIKAGFVEHRKPYMHNSYSLLTA
ncbi:MAG: hypothetical protein EGP61_00890 [[Eubacterium] rectale]|nr:hypothetical protein [Agathobacter rectalis]